MVKQLCLFYHFERYYLNERGEKSSSGIPSENISENIESLIKKIISQYGKRNSKLYLENIPEDDRYEIKGDDFVDKIKERLKDTKIELG